MDDGPEDGILKRVFKWVLKLIYAALKWMYNNNIHWFAAVGVVVGIFVVVIDEWSEPPAVGSPPPEVDPIDPIIDPIIDPCAAITCHDATSDCKVAGTCTAGNCSTETNARDGITCGTAAGHVCTAGVCGDPCEGVTCPTATGDCKVAGTCTATPGTQSGWTCSAETNAANWITCDDDDPNTAVTICMDGVCSDPCADKQCPPAAGNWDLDDCIVAGTCQVTPNSSPGWRCPAQSFAAQGTTCDDSDAATSNDVCRAGVCSGVASITSGAGITTPAPVSDRCSGVTCSPASGPCTVAGTCQADTGTCSAETNVAEGTTCDDGDAATSNDECRAGVCVAGAVDCVGLWDTTWSSCYDVSATNSSMLNHGCVQTQSYSVTTPLSGGGNQCSDNHGDIRSQVCDGADGLSECNDDQYVGMNQSERVAIRSEFGAAGDSTLGDMTMSDLACPTGYTYSHNGPWNEGDTGYIAGTSHLSSTIADCKKSCDDGDCQAISFEEGPNDNLVTCHNYPSSANLQSQVWIYGELSRRTNTGRMVSCMKDNVGSGTPPSGDVGSIPSGNWYLSDPTETCREACAKTVHTTCDGGYSNSDLASPYSVSGSTSTTATVAFESILASLPGNHTCDSGPTENASTFAPMITIGLSGDDNHVSCWIPQGGDDATIDCDTQFGAAGASAAARIALNVNHQNWYRRICKCV
jgi:hypothetical protein